MSETKFLFVCEDDRLREEVKKQVKWEVELYKSRERAERKQNFQSVCYIIVIFAIIAGVFAGLYFSEHGAKAAVKPIVTAAAFTVPAETPKVTPKPVRFKLSAFERKQVEEKVAAEARGEDIKGQMLVCQCILNACEESKGQPSEVFEWYNYDEVKRAPTESVKAAVSAVFDRGETVTDKPILFFYNPAKVDSEFHESQSFMLEHGGHRFFARAGK